MLHLEKMDKKYSNFYNFGFLCDKVGSGKSFDILGLIAHKKNVEYDI